MDAGQTLRAARKQRRLSQRETAELAGVPATTLARVESGKCVPRLETFVRLLDALGFRLTVSADDGAKLTVDSSYERARDRAGRHLPAHLWWEPMCDYPEQNTWWGWRRVAWLRTDPAVPPYWYLHRPRWFRPVWPPDVAARAYAARPRYLREVDLLGGEPEPDDLLPDGWPRDSPPPPKPWPGDRPPPPPPWLRDSSPPPPAPPPSAAEP